MELWQVIIAIVASNGFWAYLTLRTERDSSEKKMLVGLAHDRIHSLGMQYVEDGQITNDEFENLHKYLYTPYKDLGGNGSADRIMEEVKKLPIRSQKIKED